MHSFTNTLAAIRKFFDVNCDSSKWFATAYVSWYRGGKRKVNLQDVIYLDPDRFELFTRMLQLRNMPGWDDFDLYELEQYAIKLYKL